MPTQTQQKCGRKTCWEGGVEVDEGGWWRDHHFVGRVGRAGEGERGRLPLLQDVHRLWRVLPYSKDVFQCYQKRRHSCQQRGHPLGHPTRIPWQDPDYGALPVFVGCDDADSAPMPSRGSAEEYVWCDGVVRTQSWVSLRVVDLLEIHHECGTLCGVWHHGWSALQLIWLSTHMLIVYLSG